MELPKRQKIRLENYDYAQNGAYFITICTHNRKKILSNISVGATNGRPPILHLTKYGKIVEDGIKNITNKYPSITVDKYIIMPDHIHLILMIQNDKNGRPMVAPTIGRVINQTKGHISKQIGFSIWQKSYYDHVIRNQEDYNEIFEYIENNPKRYALENCDTEV